MSHLMDWTSFQLGDFNFRDIVWPDRLSKNGTMLSQSEGQVLVDIMNDHGLKQQVNSPTREENTLDLILTSLPGQFQEVHSSDKLSDHHMVAGTLKVFIPPRKKPRRKVYLYQKGDLDSMRRDSSNFAKDKYFSGHSGSRSVQENFNLITSFLQEAVDKYIPSKTSRSVASVPWITSEIRRNIRKRNKTHEKAKKTVSSKLRSKFQELRQQTKADIKKQHDLYVNKLVGDIKINPQKSKRKVQGVPQSQTAALPRPQEVEEIDKDFYRHTNSQRKDNQGIPPLKRRKVVVWLKLSRLRSSMVSLQIGSPKLWKTRSLYLTSQLRL